jgi:tripartite-type tricarboxylate transporter receptor subunit TctC
MLEFTRRSAVASLAAFIARPACAETQWPNRPLMLLQGYVAGGPTDTVARLVADGLSKRLGQQVIVDSKPGAAGTIAAAQVAKAAPDGYTLMIIPGGHAAAAALYKKLPYRPVDDFSLIGMIAEYPFIFVTYPDHAIKSAGDLIALAHARDVPLLYGTPGIGSVHHLSIELFAKQAGIRLNHVPYRGSSQAVTDLIGKRIDFMIDAPTLALQMVQGGQLRAFAVSGAGRLLALPDVPAVSEAAIPGYIVTSWQCVAGPAGIATGIVARLSREIAEFVAEPDTVNRLRKLGSEPAACSPEALKARLVADIEKWTGIVAAANIERI